jgi:hypothetical protein
MDDGPVITPTLLFLVRKQMDGILLGRIDGRQIYEH